MATNEPKMSRREVMLQALRLAGAGAATTAAAFWLSEHSSRPSDALAANAKRDHTVKANALLPDIVVVQETTRGSWCGRHLWTWAARDDSLRGMTWWC